MKRISIIMVLIFFSGIADSAALTAFADEKAGPLLENHPRYSTYKFRADEHTIDFAIQPLATPLGVIAELMTRDRILYRQLKRRNAKIAFHSFFKGQDSLYFMRLGNIDAAMVGDYPAISIAATNEVVIVGLVKQGYSDLIAKRRTQMQDLKGKRIGYVAGSTAHYLLLIALQTANIRETDVTLVPMEINDLADAIEHGRIDAVAAFQPAPAAILEKHPDFTLLQRFLSSVYLVFTRSFVTRHPEEAGLVMASYLRALRWIKKDDRHLMTAVRWNVDGRARFQGRPSDVSPELIAEITRKESLPIAAAPYVPLKDLTAEGPIGKGVAFLRSKKLIPEATSWERIRSSFDRDIMARVLANPRKYEINTFDYNMKQE